jgi:hypothetical protein
MQKFEFNWGKKIALLYISFVLFMVVLAVMASGEKQELVSDDYYARELRFQEELNIKQQTKALQVQPQWKVAQNSIAFLFPTDSSGKSITANIVLYKASDRKMDKSFDIKVPADGKYTLPTADLGSGVYKLILNWNENGKQYINEGIVNI